VKKDRTPRRKVWGGFFDLWTMDRPGEADSHEKETTLGVGSLPKHEAQQKLADYISEYTGKLTKQGDSILDVH
jgi:hypothetical protein